MRAIIKSYKNWSIKSKIQAFIILLVPVLIGLLISKLGISELFSNMTLEELIPILIAQGITINIVVSIHSRFFTGKQIKFIKQEYFKLQHLVRKQDKRIEKLEADNKELKITLKITLKYFNELVRSKK